MAGGEQEWEGEGGTCQPQALFILWRGEVLPRPKRRKARAAEDRERRNAKGWSEAQRRTAPHEALLIHNEHVSHGAAGEGGHERVHKQLRR